MTQHMLAFAGGRLVALTLTVDVVDLLLAGSAVIDDLRAPGGGSLTAICVALRIANESTKMEAFS